MFKTRLISGIILVLIAIGTITAGGAVLALTLLLVSLTGVFELYRVLKLEKTLPAFCGYLAVVLYYLYDVIRILADTRLAGMERDSYTLFLMTVFLIALMAVYVFTYPRYHADQIMGSFFAFFYVAVLLSCILRVRMLEHGRYLVWLVFFGSWGCDTCAYCVGMLIGKHKMSPRLSPKKSVEGAVGGVVGAALLGAVYGAVLASKIQTGIHPALLFAVICAAAGLISMVGDLAASAIKRNYKIKDYGTLIPGHGGILDRFDSVIFIAPVIYYLSVLLIG